MDSGRGQATLTKLMSLMTSSQSSQASGTSVGLMNVSTKGINISGASHLDTHMQNQSQSHSHRSPKSSFIGIPGQRLSSPIIGHLDGMSGGGAYFTSGRSSHREHSGGNSNSNSNRDPTMSPKSTDLDSVAGSYSRPRLTRAH